MSNEYEDLETESEEFGISEDLEEQEFEAAEDGTSDTEETELSEDDTETEASEEYLVPGRFKNTKDDVRRLADSYRNLEAQYNRVLNQVNQRNSQETPEDKAKRLAKFRNEIQEDPLGAIQNVAREGLQTELEQIKAQKFEAAYERFSTNPEFKRLEGTMTQLAEQYGDMIIQNNMQYDPRTIEILFNMAKGLEAEKIAKSAEARGKQAGTKAARKRQKAQVEGASGSKGQKFTKFEELSIEEMEKKLGYAN